MVLQNEVECCFCQTEIEIIVDSDGNELYPALANAIVNRFFFELDK